MDHIPFVLEAGWTGAVKQKLNLLVYTFGYAAINSLASHGIVKGNLILLR